MRCNIERANAIWQMIHMAGTVGVARHKIQTTMGISHGNLDGALAGMEGRGYMICEDNGRLFALAHLDEPEQDWPANKDRNYFYNRYRVKGF